MKLVVPYLWGIETFYCFVTFNHNKCVLYLTYEELKRIYSFNVNNPSNCCTLPMRNWNESPGLLSTILHMFGCTLPMRNWNHCLYWWQEPFWFYTVVPYLWGIETFLKNPLNHSLLYQLYLTYEELKQFHLQYSRSS